MHGENLKLPHSVSSYASNLICRLHELKLKASLLWHISEWGDSWEWSDGGI